MTEMSPSPSAPDGRGPGGRFAAGNGFSRGNPLAGRVQKLRAALVDAVTVDDFREIVAALLQQAKAGDVVSAREVFDRTIGKSSPVEILQRLESLELAFAEKEFPTNGEEAAHES